ncbi:MAG: hypothetical protein ACPL7O_11555 [Armatimonadota bacterium]
MHSRLDRRRLKMFPLSKRDFKLDIEAIAVFPESHVPTVGSVERSQIKRLAEQIKAARQRNRPVVLTYGAHLVKNGLAPLVIRLIEEGWVTHIATNGAGSIHDWEFAFCGRSAEDVRLNVAEGKFGTWEETGRYINLAVAVGGIEGMGYGWSVGKMIAEDGMLIPNTDTLRSLLVESMATPTEQTGAAAEMIYLLHAFDLTPGWLEVPHTHKHFSIQYAAFKQGIPFTVHPGIGYDIIYTHPLSCGGSIGRGSMRDFLTYADTISHLEGGVHLAVGSAVMAPMIFEKSLSMANNLSIQERGRALSDYYLVVVDIQDGGGWDWSKGEPPSDNPAYYLRFCKSFYRMGGKLDYICLDNVAFMLTLYNALCQ